MAAFFNGDETTRYEDAKDGGRICNLAFLKEGFGIIPSEGSAVAGCGEEFVFDEFADVFLMFFGKGGEAVFVEVLEDFFAFTGDEIGLNARGLVLEADEVKLFAKETENGGYRADGI